MEDHPLEQTRSNLQHRNSCIETWKNKPSGERINEAALMGRVRDAEAPVGQAALASPSSLGQREMANGERHERARGMVKGKELRGGGHKLNSAEKYTDKYKFSCPIFTRWISW